MSVHFVFEFVQVPHDFPSKDDQSEDEVSSLHFLIFKLYLIPSWQINEPVGSPIFTVPKSLAWLKEKEKDNLVDKGKWKNNVSIFKQY